MSFLGSGKTSLLNTLAGIVPRTSGTITLNGNPFTKLQRRKLAYVLQSDVFLSRLTLRETLYVSYNFRVLKFRIQGFWRGVTAIVEGSNLIIRIIIFKMLENLNNRMARNVVIGENDSLSSYSSLP
jgi:ABC-type sugar transport system ATPase subunit